MQTILSDRPIQLKKCYREAEFQYGSCLICQAFRHKKWTKKRQFLSLHAYYLPIQVLKTSLVLPVECGPNIALHCIADVQSMNCSKQLEHGRTFVLTIPLQNHYRGIRKMCSSFFSNSTRKRKMQSDQLRHSTIQRKVFMIQGHAGRTLIQADVSFIKNIPLRRLKVAILKLPLPLPILQTAIMEISAILKA